MDAHSYRYKPTLEALDLWYLERIWICSTLKTIISEICNNLKKTYSTSVFHACLVTGLYCKWTIRGEEGTRLKMRFLDFDVPPNDPKCDSDGVVVYDPNNKVQKGNRDAPFLIFSEIFLHFL